MPLAALILKNLWSKKARSIGIAFAIKYSFDHNLISP